MIATKDIGTAMKLHSHDHMEKLDDLKILPIPCCASWSKNDLHCPIHSRPRREFEEGHIFRCAWGVWPWYECPDSPDGEHHFQSVWSGWPGTWCIYCRADDQFEVCLMRHCSCGCHHKFWKEYWNIAMRDIGVELEVFGL